MNLFRHSRERIRAFNVYPVTTKHILNALIGPIALNSFQPALSGGHFLDARRVFGAKHEVFGEQRRFLCLFNGNRKTLVGRRMADATTHLRIELPIIGLHSTPNEKPFGKVRETRPDVSGVRHAAKLAPIFLNQKCSQRRIVGVDRLVFPKP